MSFFLIKELLWLCLIPFLIVIYVLRVYLREARIKKWIGNNHSILRSNISFKKRHIKITLSLCTLSLIIIALARPQKKGEILKAYNKGIYLLLMLDASHSMLSEDVKPNRLSLMKKEISRLIDLSSGDQIALGLFANSAILATPFTNDFSAVKSYLQDLSTDHLTNQGTNFKKAFLLSEKTFKKIKENKKEKALKVLIIASDGESSSQKNYELLKKILFEQPIRIFTLSFGTKQGGPIPLKDNEGNIKSYKKDSQGNLVQSRLREEDLKQFAKLGNGAYYHVSYGSRSINQLRKDLDLLEKTSMGEQNYIEKKEIFQWFLIVAILLAITDLILSDRVYKFKYR